MVIEEEYLKSQDVHFLDKAYEKVDHNITPQDM
jgi:hypothetical protein